MARKKKTPAPAVPPENVRTVHVLNPEAMDEAARDAAAKKAAAEATRAYVLQNFQKLIGCTIDVEILRLTNCPSHNCLMIDDHLMLSYVEAEGLLRQLEEPA